MIGRDGELTLVESFLDGAGPGTHALLLQGEAGIGKTTIWRYGEHGRADGVLGPAGADPGIGVDVAPAPRSVRL